jgi:hypothetical protein
MAFKNLEQRFNENVNKLYAGATLKFDNGKASTGRNDDPLIVRNPGKGYWNFAESRSTPVASAALDVKRLTLFTLSKRGLLFLAKQQLLQTGNTFEHTRIINPAFAVGNAVPFLHIKRNLRPLAIGGTVGKVLSLIGITKNATPNSPADLRKIAQLQQETYDKYTGGAGLVTSLIKKIPVIGQTISAVSAKRSVGENLKWDRSRPELGKDNADYYVYTYGNLKDDKAVAAVKNILKKLFKIDIPGPSGVGYGAKESNGNYITYLNYSNNKKTWNASYVTDYNAYRTGKFKAGVPPKISDVATKFTLQQEEYKSSEQQKILDTQVSNAAAVSQFLSDIERLRPRPPVKSTGLPILAEYSGKAFVRYFSPGNVGLGSVNSSEIVDGKTTNMRARIAVFKTGPAKDKRLSYIKDESNLPAAVPNTSVSKKAYQSINNAFDDPIVVSFAMGKDTPIRFRAYIKDLQQSATPEYKSYQYIGRMEKFVNYVGVQRDISFKLGVVAFSKDELEGVWRRINYLTGLVFPYGFNRGIFQPNIARLTIGNVYVEQPGYVTALSTNFNQLGESWEIDDKRQVPIAAEMDIKFIIIEKSSKIADSPFYGITEKMNGFSEEISTTPPGILPSTTLVETRKNAPSTKVSDEYDVVERNLINAYNVAVERGATRFEIDAIMQRLGTIRRERLNPGALPNRS